MNNMQPVGLIKMKQSQHESSMCGNGFITRMALHTPANTTTQTRDHQVGMQVT